MGEQLGQIPDPEKMPLEISVFPEEIQVAFFMFNMLSDKWDGMSGSYMGKDWNHCQHLFTLYEVDDQRTVMYFMKMYEAMIMEYRFKEQEQKRKAEERKRQQSSGKTYTHNVKG